MLYASLTIILVGFWLVLSGHYTAITLVAGAISILGVVALAYRMNLVDEEGHPVHLVFRAITYLPWLVLEIAKASWQITKIILDPKLPISPTLIRVRASQKTSVGRAVYANSITLTPGTIAAEVSDDEFLIHAVTREGADDLAAGAMDNRVKQFEGAA